MKIGYSVEGSTDRAFLKGLKERWCPHATLVEGPFRGSTHVSLRREYRKICEQFALVGVDVMVFLTDGNGANWREVQRNERDSFPADRLHYAIHGVPDRNIESWICSDAIWVAQELRAQPEEFHVEDPKGIFQSILGIDRDTKHEDEISSLVERAPLRAWLGISRSFEDFYEGVRRASQQLGCDLENLRET